jgi:hypothetical protein
LFLKKLIVSINHHVTTRNHASTPINDNIDFGMFLWNQRRG